MRLAKPIEVSGHFSLPGTPERKVAGTLTIKDGAEISLSTVGFLETGETRWFGSPGEIPRIIGEVEEYGWVTLEHCFYKRRTISSAGLARNQLHVSQAFLKVGFDLSEAATFTSFYFSADGLEKWHEITGIGVKHDLAANSVTVLYSSPAGVRLWDGNGTKIGIRFSCSVPSSAAPQVTISENSHFHIEYDHPVTLEHFSKLAHKLVQFLTLAVDKAVTITELTGRSPAIVEATHSGTHREIDIPIFFPPLSFCEIAPEIRIGETLFQLKDLGENSHAVIDRWFDLHEKVGPGMNLYFSGVGDEHKYISARFLLLAQALETYHRRTTETKVKLGMRFKRLLARFPQYFGNEDKRLKMEQAMVWTRNYFTHYDNKLGEKVSDGIELWHLCASMAVLFRLVLMEDIGFTTDAIDNIVKRNFRLKHAVSTWLT